MECTTIINVPINLILENKLSFDQYMLLVCVCHKDIDSLEKYVKYNGLFRSQDITYLSDKDLILPGPKTHREIIATDKAYKLIGFSKEDSWFEELWDTFPRITDKGRILKQIAKAKAKKKYLSRISTEYEHNDVISCLKAEIEHRKSTNQLHYMQNLETWLNNESWKAFEKMSQTKQYGTELE